MNLAAIQMKRPELSTHTHTQRSSLLDLSFISCQRFSTHVEPPSSFGAPYSISSEKSYLRESLPSRRVDESHIQIIRSHKFHLQIKMGVHSIVDQLIILSQKKTGVKPLSSRDKIVNHNTELSEINTQKTVTRYANILLLLIDCACTHQ